ncbi:pilin [Elusimicrobium minutum]|uniref:pilin n=1 Tax=Elusimicrobium minutum TaxID=423605 RepID=UPI0001617F1C|nr:hypothetical protein [Elusimicrobium minutum]
MPCLNYLLYYLIYKFKGLFKQGLALIALPAVALNIGILAAIALPQYQNAVVKNRYTKLIILTKAIKDPQERLFLQQCSYGYGFYTV